LLNDIDGFFGRELSSVMQQAAQVAAAHVFHGDELQPARFADIEDADDVLVGDLPRQQQLLREALNDLRMFRQIGPDALESDYAVNVAVMCLVDSAHAAHAEDLKNFEPPPENGTYLQDRSFIAQGPGYCRSGSGYRDLTRISWWRCSCVHTSTRATECDIRRGPAARRIHRLHQCC
jgi:hypothetical protein